MKRIKRLLKKYEPIFGAQTLGILSFCFATLLFITNCNKIDPGVFGENAQCKNRTQWLQSTEVSTAIQNLAQHQLVGAYLHRPNGFEWWSDNGELLIAVDYQYLENSKCSFPARIKDISMLTIVSGDEHIENRTLLRYHAEGAKLYTSIFEEIPMRLPFLFRRSWLAVFPDVSLIPIRSGALGLEFHRSGSIRSFAYFDPPNACIPPPCLNRVYFFAPNGVLLDSLAESNAGINKLIAEEIAKDLVNLKLGWYPAFLSDRFGLR